MKTICELFGDAMEDLTLRILCVSSCISILVEVLVNLGTDKVKTAWIEGFAIMVAVIVVSSVTAVNDYQKERQFQELNNVADERKVVTVFRNGVNQTIHMSKVMVGDLVALSEGMEIPADGYLIQSAELTTDESAMTGESDPVKKNVLSACHEKMLHVIAEGEKNSVGKHGVPSCIIMSGTRILTGEGKMIIIVVGDSSCVGKISALLRQNDPEETPLQSKLTKIATDIGKAGLYASITILIILLIRFAIERIIQNRFDSSIHVPELVHFLILAITVVVVAVPEGLPLAVTLSLAYSVKKMLNDQNLVRKMQACETMGGANNICSDKTGTLTKNLMTLTTWWNDDYVDIDYENKNDSLDNYMSKEFQPYFIHSCALNSSAQIRPDEKGSKTEVAILNALDNL